VNDTSADLLEPRCYGRVKAVLSVNCHVLVKSLQSDVREGVEVTANFHFVAVDSEISLADNRSELQVLAERIR
jgi:hypothetical protein